MYIFPDMLNAALANLKQEWTSNDHRIVAENVLLCNPRLTSMDALMDGVKAINSIPQEQIRTVTLADLIPLGIPIN